MPEKNLPIKLVEKRSNDQMLNEPRGGDSKPKWVLKGRALREKSAELSQAMTRVESKLVSKASRGEQTPVIVNVQISEKAAAKGHRKEIAQLFNLGRKLNTIGLVGENELIVKVESERDLSIMLRRLSDVKRFDVGISAIETTSLFVPIIEDINEVELLKVKLFYFSDERQNLFITRAFEDFCIRNSISWRKLDYGSEQNIYQVSLPTKDAIDDLEGFDGLWMVNEMPVFDYVMDEIEEVQAIDISQPDPNYDYPIVGVLDTGISDHAHFKSWKIARRHTNFPEDEIDRRHGSMVTSVLLHGDRLQNAEYTRVDGCKVMEAVVYPAAGTGTFTEYMLLENVREAIEKNKDIKIWNLCLGSRLEAGNQDFSDFAKALDELQAEHEVLIIKSAGNCFNYQANIGRSRISKWADSVRSVVVGSIAQNKILTDLVDANNPSPFTRIGPGPANIIKPDLVHYGGNTGFLGRREVRNGIYVIGEDGTVQRTVGTSFSTPRVTSLAAGLQAKLQGTANPILVKALLIHSAKFPTGVKLNDEEKIKHLGFGIPTPINEVLNNDVDEITMVFQDKIVKGSYTNIMDFPFPGCLVDDDGYYYGQLTITLVTDPILDKNQGLEYCQSDIEVHFGSYDDKVKQDLNLQNVKNPIKTEGQKNLLRPDCYSKKAMKAAQSHFADERLLRNFHKKYQPVKKWIIDLQELKPAYRRDYLQAPKQWYLELKALFRDNAETKIAFPSLGYALIITIRDTKKKGQTYNQVANLLRKNNFNYQDIQIRQDVRLNNAKK